jgi:hypothetical protein
MVACDNDACPREWFHLSCVGLTKPPGRNGELFSCLLMKVMANERQSNGTVTNARRICDEVGVGDESCHKGGKFIIAWRLGRAAFCSA